MNQAFAAQSTADAIGSSQSDLLGLAVLGKTALALAVVIGVILLCSALLKRMAPGRGRLDRRLKVVSSTSVGQRERVVIVEVEDTWLVLGVGGGQVNTLHQMPAPPEPSGDSATQAAEPSDGFAARFASAMRHNTRARFSKHKPSGKPGDDV